MFKSKTLTVKETRPLSGKDAKGLRKKVADQFPQLNESAFAAVLPPKADIVLWKLSNKCQAWAVGPTPLFFDLDGRGGALLPTVYALWASPVPLLPEVHTFSEVSPKVLGGADLFLQGFIVPSHGLPRVLQGDLAVVRLPGNPSPFALGVMEVSADAAVGAGMKGKGLKLLHHYPDALWSLGDRRVPGAEFTPARVWPLGEGPGAGAGGGAEADGATAAAAAPAAAVAALSLDGPPPAADDDDAPSPADADADAADAPAPAPTTPGLPPGVDPDTPAGQDAVAEFCLLSALAAIPDGDLPMLTSDLYSKHMVPAKPAGVTLDLKKSTFKQLSKLLKKYEKAGLLATKLVRKQDALAKIDRSHPLYVAAAPAAAAAAAARAEEERGNGGGSGRGGKRSSAPAVAPIAVDVAYKPSPMVKPILSHAKPTPDDLLCEAAVRSALKDYAKANGLRASGEKSATLDKLLVGALFSKREREDGVREGDALPLGELGDRLVARLAAFTRVTRTLPGGAGTATATRKGPLTKLRVTVEDRHAGRKHLTKLVGCEAYALDPDATANALQKALKTSASVAKLPGKDATDKEVALQGDLLAEVVAWLAEAGVGGEHVEAVNKR